MVESGQAYGAEGGAARGRGGGSPFSGRPAWVRLSGKELLPLGLLVTVIIVTCIRRLPPGVCFGDAGDFQLASTVLGIPHPPGYAAYVSLAHLATWIPGVDPAYAVSLLCFGAGLLVLFLCALLPVLRGANPWTSSAVAMALTGHTKFWMNLTTPEVYIFSAAFLLGSVVFMVRFSCLGRRRDLWIAALLYGVALANRPPILFAAPFFIVAWWLGERTVGWRARGRSFLGVILWAAIPGLYSLGFFYLRDTPHAAYNYLEHHNAEAHELPDSQSGFSAKAQRIHWLVTAAQFHYRVGNDWRQMRAKLRWLKHELLFGGLVEGIATGALIALGVWRSIRRCKATAILLAGMAAQSITFILIYKDYGQAADLTPLLTALTIFAAMGLAEVLPRHGGPRRTLASVFLLVATSVYTINDVPHRPRLVRSCDATWFVTQADLATFPPQSVILTRWTEALPLLYELETKLHREDIRVAIAQPSNWLPMAADFPGRPIFVVKNQSTVQSHVLTPFRNMWRLGPPRETK